MLRTRKEKLDQVLANDRVFCSVAPQYPFSICSHIACSSESSASVSYVIVKDVAPRAAVLTKSLRFIWLSFPPQCFSTSGVLQFH